MTLCEKCPNTEFLLVQIQEIMPRKNSVFGHFSRSASITVFYFILVIAEKFIKIFRDKFYIRGHHNPLKKGESKT